MNSREFFIHPQDYGLPTRDELVAYRIWDNHFHGFAARNPIGQYERNNFFVERMGIERSIAQEVGIVAFEFNLSLSALRRGHKAPASGRTPSASRLLPRPVFGEAFGVRGACSRF